MRTSRGLAIFVLLALSTGTACSRGRKAGEAFRLGYFPNVTHAHALVGVADGTLSRAVGGRLEAKVFNAGPAAMEALVAGDLDASYVGPSPAVITYLRTHGQALAVVAGAVSGGAVLVVRDARSPKDLVGKRVASPQLGNTQDVALRTWLRTQGLTDEPGKPNAVQVTPISNPDILGLFSRGDLAGAWVPEPWGSRLVREAKGRILVDEATLWPGRRFPTTLLVVSRRALEKRREEVASLLRAHVELTRRWSDDPARFAALANDAFRGISGKELSSEVLKDAFSRLEPLDDPLEAALVKQAKDAQALGYAPPGDLSGIVDRSLLQEVAHR